MIDIFEISYSVKAHASRALKLAQVEEPLPNYYLMKRFCWSWMICALCYGFYESGQKPSFLPCFRTLQCGANPKGDFWSSNELKEFRKSLLDGSFRYCQKNNCANLIGGWLPRKVECINQDIIKIIDGNLDHIPQLEELHFSYDSHCNLKCPSCRLEIKTNTRAQNDELNKLYVNGLAPLVHKAKHLCLSGCGEALVSPHSRSIITGLCSEIAPDLKMELRTNVTPFTPTNWESLGEGQHLIRHVAASIDDASQELFEKLRFPAKWNRVQKNLEFIQSQRNAGELDMFEFHVVVQNKNIDELINIIKLASKYGVDVVTFSKIANWMYMAEDEYLMRNPFWVDNPNYIKLRCKIIEIEKLRSEIESGSKDFYARKKKLYINMHGLEYPNNRYNTIRNRNLKIR